MVVNIEKIDKCDPVCCKGHHSCGKEPDNRHDALDETSVSEAPVHSGLLNV